MGHPVTYQSPIVTSRLLQCIIYYAYQSPYLASSPPALTMLAPSCSSLQLTALHPTPPPPPHTHSLRSSFCSQGKALASFCYQVKALAVSSLLLSLSLRGNHGSFGLPQKPLAILFHIHNKHFLSHTHGVVSVCPCLHPPPWALNQLVHTLPQKFWHLHLTYYRNHHMQL